MLQLGLLPAITLATEKQQRMAQHEGAHSSKEVKLNWSNWVRRIHR
jgi:hypothetical protein